MCLQQQKSPKFFIIISLAISNPAKSAQESSPKDKPKRL